MKPKTKVYLISTAVILAAVVDSYFYRSISPIPQSTEEALLPLLLLSIFIYFLLQEISFLNQEETHTHHDDEDEYDTEYDTHIDIHHR